VLVQGHHTSPELLPADIAALVRLLVQERDTRTEQVARLLQRVRSPQDAQSAELLVARVILDEVHAALARVAEGSYGWCGQCLEPLPRRLLYGTPRARYCRACNG
jgi:RNA polymerase-binding transcription factor DksA